jgi:PPOX class probable F420-dependent enzyme
MPTIPDGDFGTRLRQRLADEHVIWFTTVGDNGTPQPNPVWFLWEPDEDAVLIYNATKAKRLDHVASRPRVSLNFNSDDNGGDIAVLAGVAEQALDAPAANEHDAYLAKYRDGITGIGMNPESFATAYSVPLRIRLGKVRGG